MNKRTELSKEEALTKINDKYVKLKDFLQKVKSYYIEKDNMRKEIVFDEVDFGSRQFMIILSIDTKIKNPRVIFRDDLTDYGVLTDNHNISITKCKELYSMLIDNIESLGCLFYSIGEGNDEYLWYDLSIPMDIFSEELLTKCEMLWSSYNKDLDNMVKESIG